MSRRLVGLSTVPLEQLPERCRGCMYWQHDAVLPRECGVLRDEEAYRAWCSDVMAMSGEYGRAAVDDDGLLGFVVFGPSTAFAQARHLPSGPPDPSASFLACLHLTPHARGRGLGTVLLRAALRDLAQRGGRSVQAFADATGRSVETSPMVSVEFLLRQGFTVERAHPQVPLLKLDLRTLVSLNENLEAVLESLRIRIAVPRHAPATLSTPDRPR